MLVHTPITSLGVSLPSVLVIDGPQLLCQALLFHRRLFSEFYMCSISVTKATKSDISLIVALTKKRKTNKL